jgi:hypothetical protein
VAKRQEPEEEEVLSASITFRISASDQQRLREVAGPVSLSLLARAALMRGLEYFEEKPERVMELPRPRPGPKRKK